jgi:hypothetical protein
VRQVWRREEIYRGPHVAEAPDLVLGLERGYQFLSENALGGCPEEMLSPNELPWSGTHLIHPDVVPGVVLANRPLAEGPASGIGLVASVLGALGVPVPDGVEGKSFLAT